MQDRKRHDIQDILSIMPLAILQILLLSDTLAGMKVYESILDVVGPYEGVLLDAYGVFWGGNAVGLLPGAKEAMQELVARGKIVGVLSNATQLGAAEIDKVAKKGLLLGPHFHFYVTSGDVAKAIFVQGKLPFVTPRKKYFLFNEAHPKYSSPYTVFAGSAFEETKEIAQADFIYLPTPHLQGEDQTDPGVFKDLIQQVIPFNLPMVCANSDRFAHEGNPPRVVVRQGSIAACYEELGGQVFYTGKPSSLSFSAAMREFHQHGITDPAKILMVGDTPETDIKGARGCGMDSALITETGTMTSRKSMDLKLDETPSYFIRKLSTHPQGTACSGGVI